MYNVITLNKEFNIFSRFYCLNILSPLIYTIKVVDKVTHCYFRLFLVWVNNFHKMEIEHEIA